jgi:hypothetical protein
LSHLFEFLTPTDHGTEFSLFGLEGQVATEPIEVRRLATVWILRVCHADPFKRLKQTSLELLDAKALGPHDADGNALSFNEQGQKEMRWLHFVSVVVSGDATGDFHDLRAARRMTETVAPERVAARPDRDSHLAPPVNGIEAALLHGRPQ